MYWTLSAYSTCVGDKRKGAWLTHKNNRPTHNLPVTDMENLSTRHCKWEWQSCTGISINSILQILIFLIYSTLRADRQLDTQTCKWYINECLFPFKLHLVLQKLETKPEKPQKEIKGVKSVQTKVFTGTCIFKHSLTKNKGTHKHTL